MEVSHDLGHSSLEIRRGSGVRIIRSLLLIVDDASLV
jgi:hypothetical protein